MVPLVTYGCLMALRGGGAGNQCFQKFIMDLEAQAGVRATAPPCRISAKLHSLASASILS